MVRVDLPAQTEPVEIDGIELKVGNHDARVADT
jgi:hypothetical protein